MLHQQYVKKAVLCALFAAFCCIATVVIQVPAPLVGYLNLGDCVVLTGAFLLGPFYGALAAGIGSALADLLSGFVQYVPATFVIKGLVALIAGVLFAFLRRRLCVPVHLSRFLAGLLGESVMVLGYLTYEAWLLGYGAAALSGMPFNVVQAALGIAVSMVLTSLLLKIPGIARSLSGRKE